MVPGVAAVQDVPKMLFESELRVKSNSRKFHLRIDFSVSPYNFRLGSVFLAKLDLENMIPLVFSEFSLILHFAHHIAKFRRSCCKSFAAKRTFKLKAHCAVSSANLDSEFCLWCGDGRALT